MPAIGEPGAANEITVVTHSGAVVIGLAHDQQQPDRPVVRGCQCLPLELMRAKLGAEVDEPAFDLACHELVGPRQDQVDGSPIPPDADSDFQGGLP